MLPKINQSVGHGFDSPIGLPGDGRRRNSERRHSRKGKTMSKTMSKALLLLLLAMAIVTAAPGVASAHCDTLNGPVVQAARRALEAGDVTPVLKWVPAAAESEVRAAFAKTVEVRKTGGAARELADTWFFETLVRVHRAGEGEPYTGLKPAAADPVLESADRALETSSPDALVALITGHVSEGLQARFKQALETRRHADHTVEAGRAYVAAYVDLLHYVEALHSAGAHGHAPAPAAAAHAHDKK